MTNPIADIIASLTGAPAPNANANAFDGAAPDGNLFANLLNTAIAEGANPAADVIDPSGNAPALTSLGEQASGDRDANLPPPSPVGL